MNKEYLERNALGYEGDTFIHGEIEKLVNKFSINHIFETGTYFGSTTIRLSEFAPVYSAEINKSNYEKACKLIGERKNYVKVVNSDSVDMLSHWVKNFHDKNCLFFLDAHWGEYWPLLDELKVISENKIKPVIIIHDFKVPGKCHGYDEYKGVPLDFDYIKEGIEKIYGADGYDYHYNDKADGAARGVIYIYPKQIPVYKAVVSDDESHDVKSIEFTDSPVVPFVILKDEDMIVVTELKPGESYPEK